MRVQAPANRAVHLITTWGASAYLEAGQEVTLSNAFLAAAQKAGCKILSLDQGEGSSETADENPETPGENDADVRKAAITTAVKLLVERGNPDDFVKNGANAGNPKVVPVQAIVGFEVSAAEIRAVFDELMNGSGE